MFTMKEMSNWNFSTAWQFFTKYALQTYIPETELYVRSLKLSETVDLRGDQEARSKILQSVSSKSKTFILIDGSSLNGKTTFAKRLSQVINAEVVDIDLICKDWVDEQLKRMDGFKRMLFLSNFDELTDKYILNNLEYIIKAKSKNNVILVGSYLEVVYRSIIARTLGKYFNQTISIYCCSRDFADVEMMLKKRDEEMGSVPGAREQIFQEYEYSKILLKQDGIALGLGMDASFIADIGVSDMFV